MKITVDRIEGSFAVVELENKTMLNVPKELFEEPLFEGRSYDIQINLIPQSEDIKELFDKLKRDH